MTKYFQWLFLGCLTVQCLFYIGCGTKTDTKAKKNNQPKREQVNLNVLCVDSPAIAATAERQWSAEGLGTATVREITAEEFSQANYQVTSEFDVIVYPADLMADLISNAQLLAVPKKYMDGKLANVKETLKHQQKFLQRYGGEFYSFPLGDVYLTLVYNKKLFDELGLKVPETWSEYGEVARKLRERGHTVQEPFADGWASRLLLNRSAAYVRSRGKVSTVFEINDLKPLIASKPFKRSLEEMTAALGDQIDISLTPADVYSNLVSGKAAMGLTWPSRHFVNNESLTNEDLAIARMPGATEWYNHLDADWTQRDSEASTRMELLGCTGRLVSVSAEAANTSVAIEFASWLCSKPTSTTVSIESPHVSMFRATHLGQPSRWTGDNISSTASDQFGEVIRELSESDVVFLFPRIPGQAEYLEILDKAVIAIAQGSAEIQSSLEDVASQWDELTEKLGREEQLRRLRMSEGYSR